MITVTTKTIVISFLTIAPILILLEIINKKVLFKRGKKSLEEIYLTEVKNMGISRDVFLKFIMPWKNSMASMQLISVPMIH